MKTFLSWLIYVTSLDWADPHLRSINKEQERLGADVERRYRAIHGVNRSVS